MAGFGLSADWPESKAEIPGIFKNSAEPSAPHLSVVVATMGTLTKLTDD